MDEMEKLVEEIASLIKIVAMYRNHEVTQAAEGAAMAIIALILSAVRDGRLDEELGVVGRWYLVGERWPPQYWTAEPQGIEGEKTIIALRKEKEGGNDESPSLTQ